MNEIAELQELQELKTEVLAANREAMIEQVNQHLGSDAVDPAAVQYVEGHHGASLRVGDDHYLVSRHGVTRVRRTEKGDVIALWQGGKKGRDRRPITVPPLSPE